jgi:hypothetical protein
MEFNSNLSVENFNYKKGNINEIIDPKSSYPNRYMSDILESIASCDYEKLISLTKHGNLHILFYVNQPKDMGIFGKPELYIGERLPSSIFGGYNVILASLTKHIFGFSNATPINGEKLKVGYEILKHFIDLGIELNLPRDESNMTLLMSVTLCYLKYDGIEDKKTLDKIMLLLLRNGANPFLKNIFYGSVKEIFYREITVSDDFNNEHYIESICPNYMEIRKQIEKYSRKYCFDFQKFVKYASQPFDSFIHSDIVNDFTNVKTSSEDDLMLFRSSRLPKVGEYVEHIYIFHKNDVLNNFPQFDFKDTGEGDDNGFASEDEGDLWDDTSYKYYRYRYRNFEGKIGKTKTNFSLTSFNAPINPDKTSNQGKYVMRFDGGLKRGDYYLFHAYTVFEPSGLHKELISIEKTNFRIFDMSTDNFLDRNTQYPEESIIDIPIEKTNFMSNISRDKSIISKQVRNTDKTNGVTITDHTNIEEHIKIFLIKTGIEIQHFDDELEESKKELLLTIDGSKVSGVRKSSKRNIIIIPEGVVEIEKEAFKDNENIEYILLPKTINTIQDNAFQKCINLKCIVIPNVEVEFKSDVFSQCDSLQEIDLPDNSVFSMFSFNDTSFTTLVYKSKNDTIPFRFMVRNKRLKEFIIPDNISKISTSAISCCDELEIIHIPKGVKKIDHDAIDACPKAKITTEHITKPEKWDKDWNYLNQPVAWGYDKKSNSNPTFTTEGKSRKIVYAMILLLENRTVETVYTTSDVNLKDNVLVRGTSKKGKVYSKRFVVQQSTASSKYSLVDLIKI